MREIDVVSIAFRGRFTLAAQVAVMTDRAVVNEYVL
jgi:hypothetical protein